MEMTGTSGKQEGNGFAGNASDCIMIRAFGNLMLCLNLFYIMDKKFGTNHLPSSGGNLNFCNFC